MNIPSDVRKFGLSAFFAAAGSIAIAFGFHAHLPALGFLAPVAVCSFWTGMGLFVASDSIDARPVSDRCLSSQILNLGGILLVIVSVATGFGCLIVNLLLAWSNGV